MMVLFAASPAIADDANANVGGVQLTLRNVSFVSMYTFKGEGLIGGEIQAVKWGPLNLTLGAVTSFLANGTPYVALNYDPSQLIAQVALLRNIPIGTNTTFGIFAGFNSEEATWITGLKAAFPLW